MISRLRLWLKVWDEGKRGKRVKRRGETEGEGAERKRERGVQGGREEGRDGKKAGRGGVRRRGSESA